MGAPACNRYAHLTPALVMTACRAVYQDCTRAIGYRFSLAVPASSFAPPSHSLASVSQDCRCFPHEPHCSVFPYSDYGELNAAFHVARYSDIADARWPEIAAWFKTRLDAAEKRGRG